MDASTAEDSVQKPLDILPPEILSRVFLIYAIDENKLYNAKWARLLLVCRRWHQIGMDSHILWSFILIRWCPAVGQRDQYVTTIDGKRVRAQRNRAGPCPLHLKFAFTTHSAFPEYMKLDVDYLAALWNPHALSSLSIFSHNKTLVAKVADILASSLHDTLEELIISQGTGVDPSSTTVHLSGSIFENNTPLLCRLTVRHAILDWTAVSGLRAMEVDANGWPDDRHNSCLSDIIDALGRCPLLEMLQLTLPRRIGSIVSSPLPKFSFPRLNLLFLKGEISACSNLVRTITDLPPTAQVMICVLDTPDHELSLSPFLPFLGHRAFGDDQPKVRVLQIMQIRDSMIPAGAPESSSQAAVVGLLYPEPEAPSTYEFEYSVLKPRFRTPFHTGMLVKTPNGVSLERMLSGVYKAWPLAHLTHVDVRGAHSLRAEHWTTLFGSLPGNLTIVLCFGGTTTDTFLDALYAHLREHRGRAVAHIILNATPVTVSRYPLYTPEFDCSPDVFTLYRRQYLMRVLRYCAHAVRAGIPLDTVEVADMVKPRSGDPIYHYDNLFDLTSHIDWLELNQDLQTGFVYDRVLHSARSDYDGKKWDSFAKTGG